MADKISLADQAYHTIKERILNLTYPPGMQLTETMLADDLHMSRILAFRGTDCPGLL